LTRSMTGFGKAEHTEGGLRVTVEVSSVNGRFFDLRVKMPKVLNQYESELRTTVQRYIERGRVTVSVFVDQPELLAEQVGFNEAVVEKYIRLAERISSKYGIENNLDVRTLLNLPQVVSFEDDGFDADDVWVKVRAALVPALEAHAAMREREGAALRDDMVKRLSAIHGYVEEIEKLAPEAVEANKERLRTKIEGLLGPDFDEARFAMEVALYADRVDITEECVRLRSHCGQFDGELSGERTSGRKLSFLLQEMNREANTIASKSQDARISQIVVRIKEELERMREQAENME